jgi:hypothetical protein
MESSGLASLGSLSSKKNIVRPQLLALPRDHSVAGDRMDVRSGGFG